MPPRVYLETTIFSYLTSLPTRDVIVVAHQAIIPTKASADAAHIALATVHGMDYLLTWNCTHIANAEMRPRIARFAASRGYTLPELCTPEELMGGDN